jgi:FdhD protein
MDMSDLLTLMVTTELPRLTQARAPLTKEVQVIDEQGQSRMLHIPAERALTVYVDKRELVTLMTLGAYPEWLVLGYLRNQRLVDSIAEIESATASPTLKNAPKSVSSPLAAAKAACLVT